MPNVAAALAVDFSWIDCALASLPDFARETFVNLNDGTCEGVEYTDVAYGTGPIDAVYKAVNKIVQVENDLTEFVVQAVTRGIDALGEVTIRITAPDGEVFMGRGADNDIVVSSAKAYVNALNRLLSKTAAVA